MTTELFYLLLTAILTGILWIPVVTGFGLFMTRTVLFTVAWIAFAAFAIELLRHTA